MLYNAETISTNRGLTKTKLDRAVALYKGCADREAMQELNNATSCHMFWMYSARLRK